MNSPGESHDDLRKYAFGCFNTGIDTLNDVLGGGIRCLPNMGMLGVIAGAAGAGKSILALQMCCAFLHDRWKHSSTQPYSAVYITHEEPASIEAQIVDFTYFPPLLSTGNSPTPILVEKDRLDSLLDPLGGKPTLHVCRVPLDAEQQGRVLQNIFDTISQNIRGLKPRHREDEDRRDPMGNVLVCVDNLRTIQYEALSAAMSSFAGNPAKEHAKDAHRANFYKELHRDCVKGHLHVFLILEEDIPEGVNPERYEISYRPEVFAADIVIRLGIRTYSTEYRERFLQIVKAKHQFYYRGKHHFSIVSVHGGGRKQEKRRGVVVYPSIPMQLSLLKKKESRPDGNTGRLTLGIPLLDKEIEEAIPLRGDVDGAGYIRPRTNSVLVCDLDAMATIIALHFALKGGLPRDAGPDSRGIFISFKHKRADIRGIAERFFSEKIDEKLGVHDFPPEYISGHKLLRDITELITEKQMTLGDKSEPLRVVLDNVFELQCKYPLITDARGFLASLLEMFSIKGVTSLLIDTVEVGEGRNPIESSFAAGLADNVFLLRHVEFHSRPHRVFSVLKLVDLHTPDNLWNLEEVRRPDGRYELQVDDTFALYKNVLAGRPEPITITFSLYNDEENSPFHMYLQGQIESLRHSFGESLNVNLYGAEEYSRVQNLLATAEKLPRGDCHIVALDEFWLRQLIQKKRLEELSEPVMKLLEELSEPVMKRLPSGKTVARKEQYVCAAHDIALRQLHRPPGPDENLSESGYYESWYAIPARNNCGTLCFDKKTLKRLFQESSLMTCMESWMDNPETGDVTWNHLLGLRKEFDEIRKKPGDHRQYAPRSFFTFCMDQQESCVSFLLELACSHVCDDHQFLVPIEEKFHLALDLSKFPREALMTLIGLLDDEELQQLASGVFRPSADEPPAVFTRQWMSTLGCLKSRTVPSEPYYDSYFRRLEPYELPKGLDGHPTPVSGTWYLGILKGSIAVETGVKLIHQFTSREDELYKLTNYIGFPVRRGFYEGQESYNLPYHERFVRLADVQERFIHSPTEPLAVAQYEEEILKKRYPLYRMLILDYDRVAPILWRLMVKAARAALDLPASVLGKEMERLIKVASNEYSAVKPDEVNPTGGAPPSERLAQQG